MKKKWSNVEKKLAKSKGKKTKFILIAVDTGDCGIGRLKGTHLHLLPNLYSGSSGKRYKSNFKIETFFDDIIGAISSVVEKDNLVIIFGPGETKKEILQLCIKKTTGR